LAAAAFAGMGNGAFADIVFNASGTGSGGSPIAASATFSIVGGDLQIAVANTSTTPTSDPANVLTAVLFQGASGLTVDKEFIPSGNKAFNDTSSTTLASDLSLAGTILGQSVVQWEYKVNGSTAGVGSAGLGFFDGNVVDKDGLVSANYNPNNAGGLANDGDTVFQNMIVIDLSGFAGSLNDIKSVKFQYGTSLDDASITGTPTVTTPVPEPATCLGGALLLLPFAASALRRMHKAKIA